MIKRRLATLTLLGLNIVCFGLTYMLSGTLDEIAWSFTLFRGGALFNPLTLDQEWHRIFTHMFLHADLLHLLLNMSVLLMVGGDLEESIGWKKFIVVYLLCGVGGGLASLYWNLFAVGVGASGAIFGLVGFSLLMHLLTRGRDFAAILPLLVSFAIFMLINAVFAAFLRADHASHIGGFVTGAALALLTYFTTRDFSKVRFDPVLAPLFVLLFFVLPRFQVQYYHAMQQVLRAEDDYNGIAGNGKLTDKQLATALDSNTVQWDSANHLLQRLRRVPAELKKDSSSLRTYISLRKLENQYKVRIIHDERYILMDSIEVLQDSITRVVKLDYPQAMGIRGDAPPPPPTDSLALQREFSRVWYDSNWVETDGPGAYYRIGYRDSLGQWQGPVRDHYANGKIQMKGNYKNGKRDGIFLYYSDHNTYESAGRYVDNESYGKWQTFHPNGRLQSETHYRERAFVATMYDSTGRVLLRNGAGTIIEYYDNGTVKTEGEYYDGAKEGLWTGRHKNGTVYYIEEYSRGVLTRGRSQLMTGEVFAYGTESLFPKPEGGYDRLNEYFRQRAHAVEATRPGVVKISFRVTAEGVLTDVEYDQRVEPELDALAKQFLLEGPTWLPAKLHGHKPVDGFARVNIEFGLRK
jgi:membrane associated rhomboid family serine protease